MMKTMYASTKPLEIINNWIFFKKGFWVPQTNKNACITTQISRPQICSFKPLSTSYPHQININIGRFLDFNMFKHYYKTMFFMP